MRVTDDFLSSTYKYLGTYFIIIQYWPSGHWVPLDLIGNWPHNARVVDSCGAFSFCLEFCLLYFQILRTFSLCFVGSSTCIASTCHRQEWDPPTTPITLAPHGPARQASSQAFWLTYSKCHFTQVPRRYYTCTLRPHNKWQHSGSSTLSKYKYFTSNFSALSTT